MLKKSSISHGDICCQKQGESDNGTHILGHWSSLGFTGT